jgi:hypothetical protein
MGLSKYLRSKIDRQNPGEVVLTGLQIAHS